MAGGYKRVIDTNVTLALKIAKTAKKVQSKTQVVQLSSAIVPMGLNVYGPYYRSKKILSRILKENEKLGDLLVFPGYTPETNLFTGGQEKLAAVLAAYPYQKSITPDMVAVKLISKVAKRVLENIPSGKMETCYVPSYLRLPETLDRLPLISSLIRRLAWRKIRMQLQNQTMSN